MSARIAGANCQGGPIATVDRTNGDVTRRVAVRNGSGLRMETRPAVARMECQRGVSAVEKSLSMRLDASWSTDERNSRRGAARRLALAALLGFGLALASSAGIGTALAAGHATVNICLETATALDLVDKTTGDPANIICTEGDSVDLVAANAEVLATFVSTAAARYDPGIFINNFGGDAKTDPLLHCVRGCR